MGQRLECKHTLRNAINKDMMGDDLSLLCTELLQKMEVKDFAEMRLIAKQNIMAAASVTMWELKK